MLMCENDVRGRPPLIAGDRLAKQRSFPLTRATITFVFGTEDLMEWK
jgi:hypothetical protein